MAYLIQLFTICICFLYLPNDTAAFLKKLKLSKRPYREQKRAEKSRIFFKGPQFDPLTVGSKHTNLVLECNVGGAPSPTIHWLKNGERLQQGSVHTHHDDSAMYEDHNTFGGPKYMRLGQTTSRLYLDCLTHRDEGEYTCVAETPKARKTQSTVVRVEKTDESIFADNDGCMSRVSQRVVPARLVMYTHSRLEFEGAKVQLFCRAEGLPTPSITWFANNGKQITEDDDNYRITKNGDLIIRDISWFENMGTYRCEASNGYGEDSAEAFLYPVARSDDDDNLLLLG